VAFDNILKPLTDGIITVDEQRQGGTELKLEQLLIDKAKELEEIKLADFAKVRKDFKALLENNADLALSANLTVEEAAAIETGEIKDQAMLDSILNKISAALIELVKPGGDAASLEALPLDDPALLNAIAILSPRNGVKSANDNTLAAQLNALTVGGDQSGALNNNYQSVFDAIKQQLGFAATSDDGSTGDLPHGKAAPEGAGNPAPNLSFLQNGVFDLSNPLLAGMEFVNGVAEQYAINLNSGTALSAGILGSTITPRASRNTGSPSITNCSRDHSKRRSRWRD